MDIFIRSNSVDVVGEVSSGITLESSNYVQLICTCVRADNSELRSFNKFSIITGSNETSL